MIGKVIGFLNFVLMLILTIIVIVVVHASMVQPI